MLKKFIVTTFALALSFNFAFAQETTTTSDGGITIETSDGSPVEVSNVVTYPVSDSGTDAAVDVPFAEGESESVASADTSVEEAMVSNSATSNEVESMFSLRRVTKWGGFGVAILLIITILMQERGVGLSSTFGGSGGFYASKRGVEKVLFRFTVLLAIAFVVLTALSIFA